MASKRIGVNSKGREGNVKRRVTLERQHHVWTYMNKPKKDIEE